MRIGAVSANPAHGNVHGVYVRQRIALAVADLADRQRRVGVKGNGVVRLRESRIKPIRKHGFCAGSALLSGLTDEDDGASPLVLQLADELCCSKKRGHMEVVSACVHDPDLFTKFILGFDFAGVRKSGLLLDRQGIEIGSNEDGGALAVSHNRNNAVSFSAGVVVFAHAFRYLESKPSELVSKVASRLLLEMRKLRIRMEMLVAFEKFRKLSIDKALDR